MEVIVKVFKQALKIELKPLYKTIAIFFSLAFFIFAMYFVQVESKRYIDVLANKEKFKQIEQSIVKKHMNYTAYGTQGFRILCVSSPACIFFHDSGASSELSSTLDIDERLHISGSFMGQQMYRDLPRLYDDFSGFFILFGSLIVLVYGFLTFRHSEYLESLGSLGGLKRIYFNFFTVRFLLLALYFTIVTAAGLGMALLNGIRFTSSDYFYIAGYLGIWLLVALVLFSAGVLIGAIKSNPLGIIVIGAIWISFFYISPLIINEIANASAAKIKSLYQQENEKWDAIMRFESRYQKDVGKFKPEIAKLPPTVRLIESFMANEYKDVQRIDQDLAKEMEKNKKTYEWYGLISPSTILLSAANEISSRGVGNLLKFYQYTMDTKDRFCQFYKYKKFYDSNEEKGVESFIKNEENIFYGRAELPGNIIWAVIELIFLASILQGFAYYAHKKVLTKVKGKNAAQWNPETLLNPSTNGTDGTDGTGTSGNQLGPKVYQIQEEEGYIKKINNHFSRRDDLLYLCRADHLPGYIDSGDYLELVSALMKVSPDPAILLPFRGKRIGSMNNPAKFKLLMDVTQIAEKAGKRYYLFDDLTRAMPIEAAVIVKERMEELNKQGNWVIMFVPSPFLNISEYESNYGIKEASHWFDQVKYCKGILKI